MSEDRFNLGSDWSWERIDALQIPDEQKAAIKGMISDKVKNLQRGHTKVAEENAQLRQQAEYGQQWNAWVTPRRHILENYQALEEVINHSGGIEGLRRRVLANPQQADAHANQVIASADNARQSLADRWKGKEISLEEMEQGMRDIDAEQSRILSTIPQVQQRLKQEVDHEIGGVRQSVAQLEHRLQSNLGSVVPFTFEAMQYQAKHPNRDVKQILETARRHGIGDFNQAAALTYGEDDLNATVEARVQERLAIEEDNLRQRYAAQNFTPESGSLGSVAGMTWRRPRPQANNTQQQNTTPPPATKDPAELDRRIWETLNRPGQRS